MASDTVWERHVDRDTKRDTLISFYLTDPVVDDDDDDEDDEKEEDEGGAEGAEDAEDAEDAEGEGEGEEDEEEEEEDKEPHLNEPEQEAEEDAVDPAAREKKDDPDYVEIVSFYQARHLKPRQ